MIHNKLQKITKKLFFLLMMVLLGNTSLLRADELTVYDGTVTNNYVPIYGMYADCYVKSEYVIPAEDLADMEGGTINDIKFYLSAPSAAALTGVFKVYLAEVDDSSISAFYTGDVTVVYQGTVNTTASIMTIEFTEGYEYNGGNLLVGFAQTTSGNYKSCSFYGQTVSGASVQGHNCSSPSSVSPTQRNFIPKTTFVYEAGSGTKYQVSAYSNPEDAGVITGAGKYNEDSECTLTATPSAAAYYFINWTDEEGEVVSTDATYTFTVTKDVTYTANFGTLMSYFVSAWVIPEESGYILGGNGTYYEGTECTLAAFSYEAYYFINWTDNDGNVISTNDTLTFNVTGDVNYYANFGMYETYTVTVNTNPEEAGYIYSGAGDYYENQTCNVVAMSTDNYLFVNWTKDGEVVSTDLSYSFTVTEDVTLVANYVTYDSATYYEGTVTNIWTPVCLSNSTDYLQGQMVMPAEDLTALEGKSIKGLKFYVNSSATILYNSQYRVYMTEHPTESINEFIDMNTATTVYEGVLCVNNNELIIAFDTPYNYYGGNLLIGINHLTIGNWYNVSFYGVDKRDAAISNSGNTNNFGSYYPMQTNFLPKTTFFYGDDIATRYNVTASVNPEGAGYVYGAGQYIEGSTCTLEAYAYPGYQFVNWTVGGEEVSTYAAYEFTVTDDVEAVANYVSTLVMTPNPAEMGNRPNNAWMRTYPVTLHSNDYMNITLNSITVDNDYFQISSDIEFPYVMIYNEDLQFELVHTAGEGTVTGHLIVNFGDGLTEMFDLSAIAYEPVAADVWETAVEVTEYPYQGTATDIYHNYMIPEAAEGAYDAVYKITVDQLSTLEVTTGSVESVFAVYPEDFNGVGGPDLENTYSYSGGLVVPQNNSFTEDFEGGLNGWWTIDVNTDGGTWLHSDDNLSSYDYTTLAHGGTGFAICYSYVDYQGSFNTDSYMVSPQMYRIEAGSTLTFWADNANDSYPEDFTVCIATAENPTAEDFVEVWGGGAKGSSNSQAKVRQSNNRYNNWRFHAIDLSAFAGENVWIAFHDVNYDMYEVWIDDVELAVARGRDVEGFVVEPGTYYVAIAAAANQFPVSINLTDAPAPVAAEIVYPANEAINIAAPCNFVWSIGAYTEEMQVLFGTDYPPTEMLIDWTDELVNSVGIAELADNTIYYVQVNERNSTGTTEGTISTFVSHLTAPVITTEHTWYVYEGEAIKVYWDAIEDDALLSYNIYVNNVLFGNTVETEVTFEELSYNLTNGYDVTVSAVYTYGESNKSNDVFFYVSGNGNVTGYVYEQDGVTPIAGATVVFEGEDVYGLTVGDQFTTDDEGAFLGSLPVGQYTGYANKEGYQQAVCQQFLVYYNDTLTGVNFVMNEVYNPVASVTVTPGDDAATVEWSFTDRSFKFNRVYRAGAYSDDKELIADSLYNTTSYNDSIWAELPAGSYKYGVSSIYEGNAGGTRGIEEVIIGEPASTNGYIPTHNLYNYSCTNQIYTGEEIGGAGTIYSIAFMPTTVNATSRNVNIYMVNTAKTSFASSTDWVPVTDADLVFSGTAYWTLNEWSTITLDTPFNFDGTNLCLVVNDITGSWVSTNQYSVFEATAQALRIYQDASSYNPAYPGTGALLNVKNYIKLVIEQSDPVGNESPIVWSEPVDKDMYTTLNFNVTLNSGESPAGAEIAFINYNENEQELYPVEPVVVDETGVYTWDSFRKGDYFVTITKEGYETFEYNCSIYEPSEYTFTMMESTTPVEGIYVSPTGWAMWADANGDRQYEGYHIMLVDAEGEVLMEEDTLENQIQLPVDDLVEGETYTFKVANKYSSGMTDYIEYAWTYVSCDNYDGAELVAYTALEGGNMVTWDNPVSDETVEFTLYDTYGDGWNGGYLTVYFGDGNVETLTLDSGSSTEFIYTLNSQHVTMVYTPGSWPEENYFEVKNGEGEILAATSAGTMFTVMTFEFDVVSHAKTLLMRDGESLGFITDTYYFDEGDTDEHEYLIRIVYPDYAMACEQEAEYKEMYAITAIANEGGYVNGDVEYSANMYEGTTCTLEAEALYGYFFKNWTKDGEVVSTDHVYTFVVEEDAEIEANFTSMSNYFIVDPNAYENTMTMTGIVLVDGVEQNNMYYELGAFSGDEVRGSAILEYVNIEINGETVEGYYVFMTIYGNDDDELTFKLYDHYTTTVEDLMCTNDLTFVTNENLGTLFEPYEVNFLNVIMVDYTFTPGWNWWSTHIELTAVDGMAMLEESLGANATQISAQSAFTNYYEGYGWYGSLTAINNEEMYRVQMNTETSFTMIGPKASAEDHPITLTKGWNHIGYVSGVEMSVNDALTNITAQQGDMVKSQKSYANYYEGYGWYGSLNSVKPGDGLMYKSTSDDAITFTYPVAGGAKELAANLTGDDNHWVPSVYSYPSNMTVMAVVELNGEELESDNYEVAAFVNGECRGSIQLVYAEPLNRYVAFLTVSGDEVAGMTFGLYNRTTGEEIFNTTSGVAYSNDAMLGNPGEPFVLSFNDSSNDMTLYPNPVMKGEKVRIMMAGDQKVVVEITNALGKVVSVETVTSISTGITAPEAAGVYTVRIISEGNEVKCQKLVVR